MAATVVPHSCNHYGKGRRGQPLPLTHSLSLFSLSLFYSLFRLLPAKKSECSTKARKIGRSVLLLFGGEHFVWHANDNLLWQLLGYLIHSTTTPPPLSLHCYLVFTIVFFVLSCFSTKSILVLVLHRGPNHLLMMLLYRYLPSTKILSKLVAMHTCQ